MNGFFSSNTSAGFSFLRLLKTEPAVQDPVAPNAEPLPLENYTGLAANVVATAALTADLTTSIQLVANVVGTTTLTADLVGPVYGHQDLVYWRAFPELGINQDTSFQPVESRYALQLPLENYSGLQANISSTSSVSISGFTVFTAVDGSILPTASIIKQPQRQLSGALSPIATLLKSTLKKLAGAITPAATLAFIRVITKLLAGAVGFSGVIIKRCRKTLAGSTASSATLIKRGLKQVAGAVTPGSSVSKRTSRNLVAVVDFVGDLAKQTKRQLAGILSFSASLTFGALSNAIHLFGGLGLSGGVRKQTNRHLVATLALVGAFIKRAKKVVAGSLSIAGGFAQFLNHIIFAVIGTATPGKQNNITGKTNTSSTNIRTTSRDGAKIRRGDN